MLKNRYEQKIREEKRSWGWRGYIQWWVRKRKLDLLSKTKLAHKDLATTLLGDRSIR